MGRSNGVGKKEKDAKERAHSSGAALPETQARALAFSSAAGAVGALIGESYMCAWFLGFAQEWAALGVITMKANMALGLLLAGVALVIHSGNRPTWLTIVASVLSAVVLAIGALTLAQHIFHVDLNIDQIFFTEPPGAAATISPNRIGPVGCASLVLLGAGLLLMRVYRRSSPYFALTVIIINLIPAVGYLYGIAPFFSTVGVTAIAWPTVVAFLIMGTGLIFASPDYEPAKLLLRRDAGGMLLRRLLPFAVAAPLLAGLLKVMGLSRGVYDNATGTGIYTIALIVIFCALLWDGARHLSRSDANRLATQEALRDSNVKLRRFYDSGLIGVIYWDAQGVITDANDRFLEMVGYSRDDLNANRLNWLEMTPQEFRQQDEVSLAELKATGINKQPYEKQFIRKDGSLIPVIVAGAMLDEQRQDGVAFVLDRSEHVRTEMSLRDSEDRYRMLHETMRDAFVQVNLDGRILDFNEPYREMLGYSRDELCELTYQQLTPKKWHAFETRIVNDQIIARGFSDVYEKEYRRKDGKIIPIELRAILCRDAEGNPASIWGIVRDITERRHAEELLRQAESQKQEFYRKTITAATEGKLVICEKQEIEQIAGPSLAAWDITDKASARSATASLFDSVREAGMKEARAYEFIGCVTEAVTNALKHARGGRLSFHKSAGSVICVVADTGPGIAAMSLPDVALVKYYSTAGTLGMGYKLMIRLADRTYLATGQDGTTVATQMSIARNDELPPDIAASVAPFASS